MQTNRGKALGQPASQRHQQRQTETGGRLETIVKKDNQRYREQDKEEEGQTQEETNKENSHGPHFITDEPAKQ